MGIPSTSPSTYFMRPLPSRSWLVFVRRDSDRKVRANRTACADLPSIMIGRHGHLARPSVKDVRPILATATADGLICYPVSTRVNKVGKDDPLLVERVPELPKGKTLSLF